MSPEQASGSEVRDSGQLVQLLGWPGRGRSPALVVFIRAAAEAVARRGVAAAGQGLT